MSKYDTTPDEIEITDDHIQFLREAGASEEFLDMVETDPEQYGVPENSAAQKIRSLIRTGDLNLSADPEDFRFCAGGFLTKLWNGDLFGAWRKADLNNTPLMLEVYGKRIIITNAIAQGEPKDYAKRMVDHPTL